MSAVDHEVARWQSDTELGVVDSVECAERVKVESSSQY